MIIDRALRVTVIGAMCGVGLVVACRNLEDPTSSTESQLVVHAVLDTQSDLQTVLIYRARTGAPRTIDGGIGDDEPVAGAVVTLATPNVGTLSAVEAIRDTFLYKPLPGVYIFRTIEFGTGLMEGGTYTLHVRSPLGEEVSGTTTLPAVLAQLRVPTEDFVRDRDTLRLSWPRVAGARSYELVLGSPGRLRYRTFTDTSIAIAGTALTVNGDRVFPRRGVVTVIVNAVDENYYDYYRAQSDPFAGAAPSHLTGAVGVFGSVVPVVTAQLQMR